MVLVGVMLPSQGRNSAGISSGFSSRGGEAATAAAAAGARCSG